MMLFLCYCPLSVSTAVQVNALTTQVYAGLFTSGGLAFYTRSYKKNLFGDFVLRIDFDIESQEFVVVMPPASFKSIGEPE